MFTTAAKIRSFSSIFYSYFFRSLTRSLPLHLQLHSLSNGRHSTATIHHENPVPTSTRSLNIALISLSKSRRFDSAISLYSSARCSGISPDFTTLNIIINCCSEIGRSNLALQLFDEITQGVTLQTLSHSQL
ncbi:hypothetical protein M5K25_002296 [Dendrobium thyrsiflorum]|uniref:Pentatricopeptide repeat-containing protein n=1 Tax=Dendrobium thyrsiflorum TaxID=117978 RepID=A0ABD0VSH2_DENTH